MFKMDQRPIGVFDSGMGGLTAVRELKKILPHEDIIYFGDTGRVPYGTRSNETIRKYAHQAMDFLCENHVKLIIAACGTVSSLIVEAPENLRLPYTGVVRPASRAAVKATRSGKIGVIGTTATINSGSYEKEMRALQDGLQIYSRACPMLVPLVENGFISPEDQIANLICERYLEPLLQEQVDTLILGCTHFPILAPILSRIMGDDVTLIDTGKEAAKYARRMLTEHNLLKLASSAGKQDYFVSDDVQNFTELAELFLGEKLGNHIKKVQLG